MTWGRGWLNDSDVIPFRVEQRKFVPVWSTAKQGPETGTWSMTCRPFVMERVMMSLSPSCEVAATVLARRPGPRTVLGSGLLCFGPGCANQPVCVCELVTGCVWIGGQRPLVGQGEGELGASVAFGLARLLQAGRLRALHFRPVSGGGPLGQFHVAGPRYGPRFASEGFSGLVPPAACF